MADLISQKSLFNADPTEGFVQYTQAVKPYHSKILEVLVEYVYNEKIEATVNEKIDWTITLTRPDIEVISSCGFGVVWDAPYVVNTYPNVKIKKAVGDTPIEVICYNDPLHPTHVLISVNPDQYLVNVGDPITFQTTGTMPHTTVGDISPGRVYYVVSVASNIIEVSLTLAGTPLSFTNNGTGIIKIHQENLKYNSFLVENEVSTPYQCVAVNAVSNQFAFIDNYTIISVNSTLKQWTVSGLLATVVTPGVKIYIHNNGGSGVNGTYTIASTAVSSGNTIITVQEPVSLLAQSNGTLNINDDISVIPNWVLGTAVKVSSTGTLPIPLDDNVKYYFVPCTAVGMFNLSTKPIPTSVSDLVNISTLGVGYISIERTELFYPGAKVEVKSTYLSRNNGIYYVRKVEQEGSYLRVYVVQKVNRTTPQYRSYDGTMTLDPDVGYDYPDYCIPLQSPDLYVDTFIDEQITFELI